MFKIIELLPGDEDFYLFENIPPQLYNESELSFYSHQPINLEYLITCFVLIENGIAKARCALYINPSLYYNDLKTACIGNYECEADNIVSQNLLSKAVSKASELGAQFIIGPMNGSTWDVYRFNKSYDKPLFFLENYHHLYYNDHFTGNDFKVIGNYFSSIDTNVKSDNPALLARENEMINIGVNFRNVNLDNFDGELEKVYNLNSIAFKKNFLFTPIDRVTFYKKYSEIKKFIDPEIVIMAEDSEKELVGYFFCINDLYNSQSKSIIVKTVARHPDKQWASLGHVMGNIMYRKVIEMKYDTIIHSFMYKEGTSTGISNNFYGDSYKEYALYGKAL